MHPPSLAYDATEQTKKRRRRGKRRSGKREGEGEKGETRVNDKSR